MSNVKHLGFRRWSSVVLPTLITVACAVLFIVCLIFGAVGNVVPLDVIEIVENAISMFDYFSWTTFCFFVFAILYFFILVQMARVFIRLCICSKKIITAFSKHDISKIFQCVSQVRTHFDTIAMLFLIYLIQALGIYGQGLSTLGFITVIVLMSSFIITNLSITYSQEKLPSIVYLLVELVRFLVIPALIAQMFIHIRIAETSHFMNSYVFIGNVFDGFFHMNFDYYSGKEIVKIIYAVFAESTFLVLTVIQMFLLINSTFNNLFQINDTKSISGASPTKKFFGIAKIAGIWIICRCVMFTFFERGDLNFDFAAFAERWYELIKDDLIPLLGYSLIGGIVLLPKIKKNISNNNKKKKKAPSESPNK